MNVIKYFVFQLIFFMALILISFYSHIYITNRFNSADIKGIIIEALLLFLVFSLNSRMKDRLSSIRLFYRVILSLLAILIAVIVTGVLTGEMKF